MPAHWAASHRAMLRHCPPLRCVCCFRRPAPGTEREKAPPSLLELRRLLRHTERRQGWAEEVGLITPGLQSVAACAFDHTGHPCAAFSVTRRQQDSELPATELVRAVRAAAWELTSALSGKPPEGW